LVAGGERPVALARSTALVGIDLILDHEVVVLEQRTRFNSQGADRLPHLCDQRRIRNQGRI
jgi:hypothetical protein